MAEINAGKSEQSAGKPVGTAADTKGNSDPGTGGGTPRKQTGGNRAAAAAGGTGTPAAGGSGSPAAGTAGTPAEKEIVSGLAAVTPPPVPESPKKKQKKPKQKKTDPNTTFNADQISALIVSLSAIVATRPGMDMFAITEVEAKQIATPLANMIAKSEHLKALSEHTDAFALVTACFVIMAPRLMLYFNGQKERKLKASGGVKLVRTDSNNEKTKTDGDRGKPVGNPASTVQNDVSAFFATMPPLGE